jgi:hypothetical protein
MRRRKLLVALAGLAVVIAVGVVALWPRQQTDRVTLYSFKLVRHGMNRSEVEKILGQPGDYRTGPASAELGPAAANYLIWRSDAGVFVLDFDARGHVVEQMHISTQRQELSPLDDLLWRLKRQWHRWFP